MCKNIGYDRGEMFYCRDCGNWMKIIFTPEHSGIPGFMVAGMGKFKYTNKLEESVCSGEPDTNAYDCKEREKCQEIRF